jgi:hypothetical protein
MPSRRWRCRSSFSWPSRTQASFAQIIQAQAKIASATAEAAANSQRQKGYENCPACAQIDLLKAIPPSVTTFAPGTGFAVTTPAR